MSILNILNELASDNSRKFKEQILKRELNNSTLQKVFLSALNPNINYYIKKIPNFTVNEIFPEDINSELTRAIWQLDALIMRHLTGHDALDYLSSILSSVYIDNAKVLIRIIERDLKCGVNESTVNKIWKDLIPGTPYMRCSQFKSIKNVPWQDGVIVQLKADGMFVNATIYEDSVVFTSRSGKVLDSSKLSLIQDEILKNFSNQKYHQLHGELIVIDDTTGKEISRKQGNGMINSVTQGSDWPTGYSPLLIVWDIVPMVNGINVGQCNIPYKERFQMIQSLELTNNVKPIETHVVFNMNDAMTVYRTFLSDGFEGAILKFPGAIWKDGTSREQFKMKIEADCDLKIVSMNKGNGKNESTFGSIRMESDDGKLVVNVSGFTDLERKEIHSNFDNLVGKVATIKYNDIMRDEENSLFLPRFVEIREDKTVADTFEKIENDFKALIS